MTILRELGFSETSFYKQHAYQHGDSLIHFVARLNGPLDQAILHKAIECLYYRHPLLRCSIELQGQKLFFVEHNKFNSIPFTVKKRASADYWQDYVELELNKAFDTNTHLWRLSLLTSNELQHEIVACFHHSIADGLSCIDFLKQLLTVYQQLIENGPVAVASLPCLPCIEDLVCKHHKHDVDTNSTSAHAVSPTAQPHHQDAPFEQRITKHQYRQLTADQTNKLHDYCRSKNVTINTFLHVNLLQTVYTVREASELEMRLYTPVNLRQQCHPSINHEHIGVYISAVITQFSLDHQTTKDSLLAVFDKQFHQNYYEMLVSLQLKPHHDNTIIKDAKNITTSAYELFFDFFTLSNKGAIHMAEHYGPLNLDFYYTGPAKRSDISPFHLSVITINDRMFLDFCYTYPLLSTLRIRNVADCYVNNLINCTD